jgi:hypothetical protein
MRVFCLGTAMVLFAMTHSAQADSQWLESKRLYVSDVRMLCERVSDVRLLARMQMISSGSNAWRRLSRQELVIEVVMMGVPPLDPDRCYVIARAGTADDVERRAFEVLDFIDSAERTLIFAIGRAYDLPPDGMPFRLPMWR